tara:strand:- start:36408 stop:36929 length:522 start_codon:yes stop_codon:yes gene_type:complete
MEADYEILPHKILNDLKYEVEALKKKLTQPDAKANELILEIESLKDSVHELTTVFQKALATIQGDSDITKTVQLLNEKLTTVVTQNETIAKGMIAISDKLEDWMHKAPKNAPTHSQSMPTMPNQHGPARVAPPIHDMASGAHMPPMIGNEHAGSQHGMPPPPPSKPKRKGLFK